MMMVWNAISNAYFSLCLLADNIFYHGGFIHDRQQIAHMQFGKLEQSYDCSAQLS